MNTARVANAARCRPTTSSSGWADLERLLRSRFEVTHSQIAVAGHALDILRPRSADKLIDEDDFNQDGRLPYWAELWPSAWGLAERLAREPAGGRKLLELGCGVGVAACLACNLGFRVTATDYYREACEFTRLNAHRNRLTIPRTRVVDWRRYPEDLRGFDVVTASDVLYEKPYCELVASCFAQSLAPDGLGILTDPQRTLAAGFPRACQVAGLRVVKEAGVEAEIEGRRQVIDVYKLWRQLVG